MTEIYATELRVPKERVAVVIGKKGEAKKYLEAKTSTRIRVSKEGDVTISSSDNMNNYLASLVIKAIGRGFNPEIALLLLNEQNSMEIISMSEFSRKSEKNLIRIRARLIGKEGKARMMLETLTNTHISVYGKTASIIGAVYDVLLAKHAVERLLQGAPHGNVYKYIESQKKAQAL
jgi:ribosomal RNA assembly protein